jgi:very-short-patch-repair endonuclease
MQQLVLAGLNESQVMHRARTGRLHRVHRGVYALGHRGLSNEGRWMAAVLACGEGSVLSHHSAAEHWGMLSVKERFTDVIVPRRRGRSTRPRIVIHRPRTLGPSEVTRRSNIPVTTPSRTLADLERTQPAWLARKARRRADFLNLLLSASDPPLRTRSDLEDLFLGICRRHRLPAPEVNMRLEPDLEVDFLWRDRRLVVEIDSWLYHGDRTGFELDRARDVRLLILGYDVVRFTDTQLVDSPRDVGASLRALLKNRAAPSMPLLNSPAA